ncbi:conserved hypothetical protein, secreted [Beggiatoa sp. PS]|nr:conserved hypothetical protein, secreted [Beggiatoa sp. PS]
MKLFKKVVLSLALTGMCATGVQAAVTQVEGQAGGGIVPWALLTGGKPTASFTWVDTGDYTLTSVAIQAALAERIGLSYARQTFDTGAVGLGKINVNVFGAKVQLLKMADGMPAVTFGVQHKQTNVSEGFLEAVGADDSGTDFYLAATKIIPMGDRKLLVNGTIRGTKANQIGILGFGSSTEDSYSAQFEGSAGLFLNDNTVFGVEYRTKPNNEIGGMNEEDWSDVFFAHFPNKNLAFVFAYANLGDIAAEAVPSDHGQNQRGLYLQIQANF